MPDLPPGHVLSPRHHGRFSSTFPTRPAWRVPRVAMLALLFVVVFLFMPMVAPRLAPAQEKTRIGAGDVVITGFSGLRAREEGAFIDLDGAVARIFATPAAASPPVLRQVITARQVGQVFAVAIGSRAAPGLYLAASAAYGLRIVAPDGRGGLRPVARGGPGARWMAGQWGPDGGPGAVWRVGADGAVALFAMLPNTGAGLGDIVHDATRGQFFVSNLDDGRIYRLSARGRILDAYDHGVDGRAAAGMRPMPDDGARAAISSDDFDVADTRTWGMTPPPRRVWALAVHEGRLYHAVGGGQEPVAIWSVGIRDDGALAADARLEIGAVPGGWPVFDMLFAPWGEMILAQRRLGRNGGHAPRVLRYRRDARGNWRLRKQPALPSCPGSAGGVALSCAGELLFGADMSCAVSAAPAAPFIAAGAGAESVREGGARDTARDAANEEGGGALPFPPPRIVGHEGPGGGSHPAGMGDVEIVAECVGARVEEVGEAVTPASRSAPAIPAPPRRAAPTPPRCAAHERVFTTRAGAERLLAEGWRLRRVARAGVVRWCAAPPPPARCPDGWKPVHGAEIPHLRRRGWKFSPVRRAGRIVLWCGRAPAPVRCPSGWFRVSADAAKLARAGWQVRRAGRSWCARPTPRVRFCRKDARLVLEARQARELRRRGWRVRHVEAPGPRGVPYWCARPPAPAMDDRCVGGVMRKGRCRCPAGQYPVPRRSGAAWRCAPRRALVICRSPARPHAGGCACPRGMRPHVIGAGAARIIGCAPREERPSTDACPHGWQRLDPARMVRMQRQGWRILRRGKTFCGRPANGGR